MSNWYGAGDCLICRLAPVVFVTNDADGRVSLYCPDCGGLYRAPDQGEFAYGDRPIDKSL